MPVRPLREPLHSLARHASVVARRASVASARTAWAGLLALGGGAGCDSAAEPDASGGPVAISLHAGDGQVARAGSAVEVAPQVRVVDETGSGAAGVAVTFRVVEGGGSVEVPSAVSDAAGVASAGGWTLGPPGRQRMEAAAGPGVVVFSAGASGVPAAVRIAAGNGGSVEVASEAPVAPAVLVLNEAGAPAPYVPVTFAAQHGSVAVPRAFTDEGGRASAGSWTLGPKAGPQRVVAAVAGSGVEGNPAVFEVTATPAQPGEIRLLRGAEPPELGRPYLPPPTARVTDVHGNGVPHVAVGFQVLAGGGSAPAGVAYTDRNGVAPASLWTMGREAGAPNTLAATVLSVGYDLTGAAATLTVVPEAADFDIWVVPQSSPPIDPAVLAALESAKNRWERAVVGDLPPFATSLNNVEFCNPDREAVRFDFPNTIPYDDLLVLAVVAAIDGPGGAAVQSGWCWGAVRGGAALPTVSVIHLDAHDVAALSRSGLLESLAAREMGHALGFGASRLWDGAGLLGADGSGPYFRGAAARAAFAAAGGAAHPGPAVPLDSAAGPAAWRWREGALGPELMTAALLPDALNPLSAVTLGALADMGYPGVNVAAADRYVVPRPGAAQGVRIPGRRPGWTRRIVDAHGAVVAVFEPEAPP